MKRSFVCLLLILTLSLLLVGCGSAADGVVGNSPAPAPVGATPALPVPSAEVSMSPVPGETMRPRGDSAGTNVDPGTGASPSPDSEMQRDR